MIPTFSTQHISKFFNLATQNEHYIISHLQTLLNEVQQCQKQLLNGIDLIQHNYNHQVKKLTKSIHNFCNQYEGGERISRKQIYGCCQLRTDNREEFLKHIKKHKHPNRIMKTHVFTKLGHLIPISTRHEEVVLATKKKQPSITIKKQNQIVTKQKTTQREEEDKEFFCGCGFNTHLFCSYLRHMSQHRWMVPENSSHIIIREPSGKNIALQTFVDFGEKYRCLCKPRKQLSHGQFIEHVMKWHKGITPQVR